MKLKNQKGITLIEVIISMAIITIALGIGYRVLYNAQTSPNNQAKISDIQNGMNNIRNFISNELKYCEGIELEYNDGIKKIVQPIYISKDDDKQIADSNKQLIRNFIKSNNKFIYQFNIIKKYKYNQSSIEYDIDREQDTYITNIFKKNNKKYYSISKKDINGVTIELVKKQEFNLSKLPMDISKEEDMYNVEINYTNKDDKQYVFNIFNEFKIAKSKNENINPPSNDEIPAITGFGNRTVLGFWTADEDKCKKNNLYTWINYEKKSSQQYGTQEEEKNKFKINANLSANDNTSSKSNDNSGKIYSHIGDNTGWKANANLTAIKANSINQVKIYVTAQTHLSSFYDISGFITDIEVESGAGTLIRVDDRWNLYGGDEQDSGTWYKVTLSENKKENFNIVSDLHINNQSIYSGYALLVYGEGYDLNNYD